MKLCYADPPYVGQAFKHYKTDPNCAEVDHKELFAKLDSEFDGWALSASSPSILGPAGLCAIAPAGCRIAAWVKPFAVYKPGVNPAYAWEPMFFKPARSNDRSKPTVKDWVAVNITMRKGLVGAKPSELCYWLFDLLGAEAGDDFTDMFPGTGVVGRCWIDFELKKTEHLRTRPNLAALDL